MRNAMWISAAALTAALPAAPALAQDPYQVASEACWKSVVREARGQLAADGIMQEGDPQMSQGSNAENIISGSATADGRPFRYSCTYNIRTGQTYGVQVTGGGGGVSPGRGGGYDPGYNPGYRPPNIPGYDPNYRPGNDWGTNRVPGWAIGRFEGTNPRTRDYVRLDIARDGRTTARINNQVQYGRVVNGMLKIGMYNFILSPARGGLTTQQKHDPSNVVYYRRTR